MPPRNGDIRSFFVPRASASSTPAPTPAPAPAPVPALTPSSPVVPAQTVQPALPVQSAQSVQAAQPVHAEQAMQAAHGSSTPPPSTPTTIMPSTPSDRATTPQRSYFTLPSPQTVDNASITSSPPSIAPRRVFERGAVIAESDDDGDSLGSSDSELPDIMAPARKRPVAPQNDDNCVTPRANKRATTAIKYDGVNFNSPLSIRKKHKYDFKALVRLNDRENETLAGEARVRELELEESMDSMNQGHRDTENGVGGLYAGQDGKSNVVKQLKDQLLKSVPAAGDDEDGTRAKRVRVIRGLERAVEDGTTGAKTFYFFEQKEHFAEASILGNAFPIAQAKGPWKILADKQDRARHFQSGLPHDIQRMFGNLPDEIFLWILNEVCQEKRKDLTREYAKLLCICDDQIVRLVTPALLQQLFKSLGATKDVCSLKATVVLTDELSDPYPDRDWTCLENFLFLMGKLSKSFNVTTCTAAMQILLRLGMDKVAVENFGLAQEWRWAVDLVARSVPGKEWTSFCQEVCTTLYRSTEKASLRYKAINLLGPVELPESPPDLQRRTLDLRRRLASVFYFDDLSRADKIPEDTVNIRAVIDRLDDPAYIFDPRDPKMDFSDFAASMLLLNIALGDAARQQTVIAPSSGKEYDVEVDELAKNLKLMSSRVQVVEGGIRVERIEAKDTLMMISDRLLYQLRTKPFSEQLGIIKTDTETEVSDLPKQKSFMEGFLKKKMEKARPSVETGIAA